MSTKAAKHIRRTIREWRLASTKNHYALEDLPRIVDPVVRGWMNYYGRYYRTRCVLTLQHLNEALAAWVRRKHKRFRYRRRASRYWLRWGPEKRGRGWGGESLESLGLT
ncbi:MAG: hypothetical protein A3H97_22600 [Acidobacteria bacterium RIFCSPLOWO2_02_FULL_65_29]|nr:MAG: hypothetical protein A3H97_22600 [Acidobacteria bacterium RIFCSPLOWO2_02_FULL_65_29]